MGLGKEMRAAILHLAFDALGAVEAHSSAFHDNASSLGTSRALGYSENGTALMMADHPARMIHLRLDRATWVTTRRNDIEVEGLEACLDMFGLEGTHEVSRQPWGGLALHDTREGTEPQANG